jgi:hypothetical protein
VIVTEFYEGQGLGNQLWSYAVLRSTAIALGYEYGIQSPQRFKGKNFLSLDMGRRVVGIPSIAPSYRRPLGVCYVFRERRVIHDLEHFEVSTFDPSVLKIKDRTKIDGYFQSEEYLLPFRKEICKWFQVPTLESVAPNICIINFRGGEYASHPKLFLKQIYYERAINYIRSITPEIEFKIVTDDVELARTYFGDIEIISKSIQEYDDPSAKIADDLRALQSACYLILSNSSFSWWGAWTNTDLQKVVVAPKYWARHNTDDGFWSLGDSLTRDWIYLSEQGKFSSYDELKEEDIRFKSSISYVSNVSIIRW